MLLPQHLGADDGCCEQRCKRWMNGPFLSPSHKAATTRGPVARAIDALDNASSDRLSSARSAASHVAAWERRLAAITAASHDSKAAIKSSNKNARGFIVFRFCMVVSRASTFLLGIDRLAVFCSRIVRGRDLACKAAGVKDPGCRRYGPLRLFGQCVAFSSAVVQDGGVLRPGKTAAPLPCADIPPRREPP